MTRVYDRIVGEILEGELEDIQQEVAEREIDYKNNGIKMAIELGPLGYWELVKA